MSRPALLAIGSLLALACGCAASRPFPGASAPTDLGWTLGPWEFREQATDAQPADTGSFFTLWQRQADGRFKFLLDAELPLPPAE